MAFSNAQQTRILAGSYSYSAVVTNVSAPYTVTPLEVTCLTDTAKAFIPGMHTSTLTLSGHMDVDGSANALFDQAANWPAAERVVSYYPRGTTIGNEAWLTQAFETSFVSKASETGVVDFDLALQTDGLTSIGVSLHDLNAETASVNSTSVDGGAATSTGAVANLHVTAFSGLTSLTVAIQDSANNSTFATIGTFTLAAGLWQERITIAGAVRQYVRVISTIVGTGSTTFQVGYART